jgi:hypothetical protein
MTPGRGDGAAAATLAGTLHINTQLINKLWLSLLPRRNREDIFFPLK